MRWAELAGQGRVHLEPSSRLADLVSAAEREAAGRLAVSLPAGELPYDLLDALVKYLKSVTPSQGLCWFAVWDGYADLPREPEALNVHLPIREYRLYQGPLAEAMSLGWWHPPALWWPEDRSWFVGGDTDLDSTYVGGSEDLIGKLLKADGVEAMLTNSDQVA